MPIYLLSPSTILVVEVIIKLNNMIDKKIEEAARRYSEVTDCDKQEALLIEEGFREGANWAINEFLKDLWHSASEEPEGYNEGILLRYNVGDYYSLAQVKDFKSWKGFVERAPIEKWLYLDDLFSEEGGNQ